jgi:hypothetical protein
VRNLDACQARGFDAVEPLARGKLHLDSVDNHDWHLRLSSPWLA